ncbi:MAG: rhomboid family intramembrane serine protease [Chitinophagaceae bacterium]
MRMLPPVVKNLIIINVIFAIAQHVLYSSFHIVLSDYLGLHYFRSELFRPWQLVTHMFMHGDPTSIEATLIHLGSNMFALWMFGSILENKWGPKRFLWFYMICGLGAALCHLSVLSMEYEQVIHSFNAYLQNPTADQFVSFINHHPPRGVDTHVLDRVQSIYNSWIVDPGNSLYPKLSGQALHEYIYGAAGPQGVHWTGLLDEATVGASGAVFGVLFAFGYLFPNLQLMFIFPPIPIKAKWFVMIYAVFELYSGLRNSAGDNVAHFAHLGGMLFAFLLLKLWKYRFGDPRF